MTWIALYFLPTIIALIREKSNLVCVFLVNLLLGWTFIGWIVALVMAASAERTGAPLPMARYAVPAGSAPVHGKYCTACGQFATLESRFCGRCGRSVE